MATVNLPAADNVIEEKGGVRQVDKDALQEGMIWRKLLPKGHLCLERGKPSKKSTFFSFWERLIVSNLSISYSDSTYKD